MSHFKTHDGLNIYYKTINRNKDFTLFFLHGWTANHTFYEPLKDYFPNFNLIFWDARCHGYSSIKRNAAIKEMADDFNFFIKNIYDLKVPVIPIGHSMGALTLFEYIKNYGTADIHKLVIVDQSPKLMTDDEWDMGIYGNFPEVLNKEFIELFKKDVGMGTIKLTVSGINKEYSRLYKKNPEIFHAQKRNFSVEQNNALTDIWEDIATMDFRDMLGKIDIPTLLIFGSESPYYIVY